MAREKKRSVTADDAAHIMEEQLRSSDERKNSSPKQPSFYPKSFPTARGNKTLGWYLCDDLFKKRSDSESPVEEMGTPLGRGRQGSTPPAPNSHEAEKRRRRGQRRGQRKTSNTDTSSNKFGSEGSGECLRANINHATAAPSEELNDEKMKIVSDFKEDFWYYDVATDGYYYEQSGARGWRRRAPPQIAAKLRAEQELAKIGMSPTAQAAAAAVAAAAQAQALLHSAYFGQPATKYYDAASDGYFYEMASVDGWKKRDPESVPPGAATSSRPPAARKPVLPPTAPSGQSYGAALARGQMPAAGFVTLDEASSTSSGMSTASSSSLSDATTTADAGLHDFLVEQFDKAMALEQQQLQKETQERVSRPATLHLDPFFTHSTGLVSTPSLLPPTSESLATRRLAKFDAEKFIEGLPFNDLCSTSRFDLAARSPAVAQTPQSAIASATPHTPVPELLGSYDWLSSGFRGAVDLMSQSNKLSDNMQGLEKFWQQPLHS